MGATTDTVHGRLETARTELAPHRIATGLSFAAAVAGVGTVPTGGAADSAGHLTTSP